ncbi:anti-sigma factor family protein [Sphingomonas xanthus]|uniref:Anti-sigma factor n=1 Tax=Sphingomonas xanthus TaxID=2594473 RepID=A0A516IR85_9SPHN|nr:anti-sigma factor [Sphingomonas xanthus]QDP19389.1 anti-sigma factor [Sphingomonas xanthus]
MITDEIFFAWLDGELDEAESRRVGIAIAADPVLAERARQHRAMQADLTRAFDPILASAVAPPTFGSAPVVDLAAARERRAEHRASFGVPQWAAMAATLAIGFFGGQMALVGGAASGPVKVVSGRMVAAAGLEDALAVRLASAPAADGARIGLTFRDKAGAICRTFDDGAATGLACRRGNDWEVDGLFSSGSGTSDYRMAAGDDPRLAALVDARIAGEPFDAGQEQAARSRDWR